jgi:aminopeptidase N
VDDIVVSTGAGTTSFEDDGDTFDGWTVPGAPDGSAPNPNDWIVGTAADAPPPIGADIQASFARQGEIIDFLSSMFGPYPFGAAGGIVDNADLGFALENQTRPIYSKVFWTAPGFGDGVVVHELAHQWYGDSLAVAAWQHIWLNEGFATYAEWMWGERGGSGQTVQHQFDSRYAQRESPDLWNVPPADPGRNGLFGRSVYDRGAMTLHALRKKVGDQRFFAILRAWTTEHRHANATTPQFIALAQRVSGMDLRKLFQVWLYDRGRPVNW